MRLRSPTLPALMLFLGFNSLGAAGCGSSDSPTETTCGGVVREGQCFKKCEDSRCITDNYCLFTTDRPEGFCAPNCNSAKDCGVGFGCTPGTWTDGSDWKGCATLAIPGAGVEGTTCTTDAQCDLDHGVICSNGLCRIPSAAGTSCKVDTDCDKKAELTCKEGTCKAPGLTGATCKIDTDCDKKQGLLCMEGVCRGPGAQGASCTTDSHCKQGLSCIESICTVKCDSIAYCADGFTCKTNPAAPTTGSKGYCAPNGSDTGPGQYGTECPTGKNDVCDQTNGFFCIGPQSKTYCSKKNGCTKDDDCPSGYWCGSARVKKAGTTSDIDFTNQPSVCLKRFFCAPCVSDVDCSFETGGICVPDKNGEKFCSLPCEQGTNSCILGAECKDVGSGVFACVPDVGVCHGSTPLGCGPCRVDKDCGPEALCMGGGFGYKPGVNWCLVPCGAPDSFGKPTCPTAPNGVEMLCMDETQLSLGGPFLSGDTDVPNYIYKHCYAPFTVDNSEMFPGTDAPNKFCGNAVREGTEECDDGNAKDNDGCTNQCKITPECTFTIKEPNGDVWATPPLEPVIEPAPNHITVSGGDPRMAYVIATTTCRTFKVTGALETAGDVDTIAFRLDNEAYAWLDSYTGAPGQCAADLKTEVRDWKNGEKTTDPELLDSSVKCEGLTDEVMNLADQKLCPGAPEHLGCGSCTKAGLCGSCDNDNGYGACNRMLLSTAVSLYGYPVYNAGKYKLARIYAENPSATVPSYTIVVSRFVGQSNSGTSTSPGLFCY